jgi:hypothetical protein
MAVWGRLHIMKGHATLICVSGYVNGYMSGGRVSTSDDEGLLCLSAIAWVDAEARERVAELERQLLGPINQHTETNRHLS